MPPRCRFPGLAPLLALTAACGGIGLVACAESVTLTPVADTTLFESAPDDNMGGWTHVAVGTTGSQGEHTRNRGLFRFAVADALPADAQVTNALLRLTVTHVPDRTGGSAADSTFALHRLLKPWAEGGQLGDRGFPAAPGEATWNARFHPDRAWAAPGGEAGADFATEFSAATEVAGRGRYAFGPTPQLLSDVQRWRSEPATNFGWLLLTESEDVSKTARRFGSREDAGNAPQLILEFTRLTAPRIEAVWIATNRCHLRFATAPGQRYTVERTAGLSGLPWSDLTNFVALTATDVIVSDVVQPSLRLYRLRSP